MTTVNTKREFLRLLRSDPEFKAEVRSLILTEELLNVPTILREMSERMGEMSERQSEMSVWKDEMSVWKNEMSVWKNEMSERMDEMSERQDETARWQSEMSDWKDEMSVWKDEMSERQRRIQDDLGVVKGRGIEFILERNIVSILSELLDQRNGTIVRGGYQTPAVYEFNNAIYDAYKSGAIDQRERIRVNRTDMIVRATNGETGETVYSAVEASWVIDDNDVIRARRSAEVLAKMYPDAKTEAVVYGMSINDRGRDAAERFGVIVSDNASE